MKVLLTSLEDVASMNIRDRLLEEAEWEVVGEFRGGLVRRHDDLLLMEREGTHLYMESVDEEIGTFIREELGEELWPQGPFPLDLLVFLSRHRSEKDVRSLTVHPPGNFISADYGGMAGKLPPSAPFEMTQALKTLYKEKKALGLKDQTTYEVTHHGPQVSSPCFFIEIGSNETRWGVEELARPIARTLISDDLGGPRRDLPVAIGVGGGHYGPRFTDRAMRNKFAFGHMVPDYILRSSDDIRVPIELAKEATPGVQKLFYHRSSANEDLEERIGEIADQLSLVMVS